MSEHVVARADELGEGERILVQLEGREVGVFNVGGEYVAYPSWCPHQSGPVCEGNTTGARTATFDRETLELATAWEREGEILVCPWHAWKFDLENGECLSRDGVTLPSYAVEVVDGDLVVDV